MQSSIVWNKGGQLILQPLPDFLQVSPIFSFSSFYYKSGKINYVAAGNFYDVLPYEGRYDAMMPTIFSIDKNKVGSKAFILQQGAIRNIQPIILKNKQQAMLLAKNNDSMVVLSYTK